jgi:acyl-CoA reductase-like NAD-dependent aldehyde dehydrogenase
MGCRSARVDTQPYGGIKDSGVGREGIKYLIAELTEPKVLLMKGLL